MKLSIITVNLNNKDGLQKTIDSVISQTYKDFEWIIIDGGSTDGSKELIEKYSDYITYWVSEPDKGIYNAMNKGIVKAHGEYLNFMNSGDLFASPTVLQVIFSKKQIADIIYGNVIICSPHKRKTLKRFHSNHIYASDLYKSTINHQSSFIRRELFTKYGYYDEKLKIVSDWKFFFETIIIHNCSTNYVDIDIAVYNLDGISSYEGDLLMKERNSVMQSFLPHFAIEDYNTNFITNEVMKYRLSKYLFSLLYRLVIRYEKFKKYI